MKKELSIIVPIYNTPVQKLTECFESVRNIKGINYDVILIDDGSKTETSSFCRDYAEQNDGFNYFYQDNAGVSSARNLGLEKADGEYICFLDSDDALVGEVISKACHFKAFDMVIYNIEVYEAGKRFIWKAFNIDRSQELQFQEVYKRTVYSAAINGCYGKIIRRELINSSAVRFIEGMVRAEDLYFVLSLIGKKPSVYYLNETGYLYRRDQSNTELRQKKFPLQSLNDLHIVHEQSLKLAKDLNMDDTSKIIQHLNRSETIAIFRWVCIQINTRQLDEEMKRLCKRRLNDCLNDVYYRTFKENAIYKLICGDHWIIIRLLAKFREIYLALNFHSLKGRS
ncbi:MAG: glycosyltransferase [Lachnospiraceae bacterium]|nr:glycosyltransferase [Lachnospiraceae bacterium]